MKDSRAFEPWLSIEPNLRRRWALSNGREIREVRSCVRGWLSVLLAFSALCTTAAHAQDSLCASVKIEIAQELTLERRAFDARMRINNGLDTIALQNVDVTVQFADDNGDPVLATSDPNDTSALFLVIGVGPAEVI